MIRFILKTQMRDEHINRDAEYFTTVDVDVPELEQRLYGGSGPSGYSQTSIIGTEIIRQEKDMTNRENTIRNIIIDSRQCDRTKTISSVED